MCGIVAVWMRVSGDAVSLRRSREAAQRLHHRGPDAQGLWSDVHVALIHTRLAILDISEDGTQPIHDPTGRFVMIFNGEIYNFKTLRQRLNAKGVHIRSSGDTEVLLQWLIHHGESGLPHLEGMFALVFYDRLEHTMLAVRDPLGVKPLLIHEDANGVVLASEFKGMMPWITPKLDLWTAGAFLSAGHTAQRGRELCHSVRWVEPGTAVIIRDGKVCAERRYFHLSQLLDPSLFTQHRSAHDAEDALDAAIQHAVRETMVSDVPVAGLCSGGVDSSLIVAIGLQHEPDMQLFHAHVASGVSELHEAQHCAAFLKRPLHVRTTTHDDLLSRMPHVMWHLESPVLKHPNCVPMMQIMACIQQHGIKVVVSGEGSDEAFLGYPLFVRRLWHHRIKGRLDGLFQRLQRLPVLNNWLSNTPRVPGDLLHAITHHDDAVLDQQVLKEFPESERMPLAWALDKLRVHLETLLRRNDRMGMAHSIEARFPLLHRDVLKQALNTPVQRKLRATWKLRGWDIDLPGYRTKWLLRKVAQRHMPASIAWRAKCGFPTHQPDLTPLVGTPESFEVRDVLGWSRDEMSCYVQNMGHIGLLRLQHLEIWHRLFVQQEARDVFEHLRGVA